MERDARAWTEEYYDIAEFFFWSPDKIGHISHSKFAEFAKPFGVAVADGPSCPEVMTRLRRIEEPLNHILGVFFALASTELIARVFEMALGARHAGPFRLLGTDGWKELELGGATQPDFCFHAGKALLMIEVKVQDGKSRLEQVVKYGLLASQARRLLAVEHCALVYLTPHELKGIFKQKFSDWETVRRESIAHIVDMVTDAFVKMDADQRVELVSAMETLALASMTFSDFQSVLAGYADEMTNEVEGRLVQGVLGELRNRSLVS